MQPLRKRPRTARCRMLLPLFPALRSRWYLVTLALANGEETLPCPQGTPKTRTPTATSTLIRVAEALCDMPLVGRLTMDALQGTNGAVVSSLERRVVRPGPYSRRSAGSGSEF